MLDKEINILLDELVTLRLNKGTQPWELMSNIENDPYKEVKAIRDRNSVMCSVTFFDAGFFDEKVVKIVNMYTYDDITIN